MGEEGDCKPRTWWSDPYRIIFVLGGLATFVSIWVHPGSASDLRAWSGVAWAAVLVGTGLVPGRNGRLNTKLAAVAAVATAAVMAARCVGPDGLHEASAVWLLTLPILYLVVTPDVPWLTLVTSAACLVALTVATALAGVEVVEAIRWLGVSGLVAAVAVISSYTHTRERKTIVNDERARARVAHELAVSQRLRARAEELASLGRLGAEVAHEIKNPLTYVVGNLEYVRDALAHSSPASVREALDQAIQGAERISAIASDLLSLARPGDTRANTHVDACVSDALRLVRSTIRQRARLVEKLDCDGQIFASRRRVAQVFVNLLTNAAHAIDPDAPAGNVIEVRSESRDGMAVIVVRDTGAGVPANVVKRIFEPFFTTKARGVGTGLGLAVCKRVVDELGGTITCESEPGAGTTFTVTLPLTMATDAETDQNLPSLALEPTRVLVIDDDTLVRGSIARALAGSHEVDQEASARAALARIEEGSYDAVVCDLNMPDVTGMDLHRELVRRGSAMAPRIVFLTGGPFTPEAREFASAMQGRVLSKPVSARKLRRLVNQLIEPVSSEGGGPTFVD